MVIGTSLRNKSNSESLAATFIDGAKAAGNDVEQAQLKGVVFAGSVNEAGEIKGHPALKKACEMGQTIK